MPKEPKKPKGGIRASIRALIKSITAPASRRREAAVQSQMDVDIRRQNPQTGKPAVPRAKRLAPEVEMARKARARRKN